MKANTLEFLYFLQDSAERNSYFQYLSDVYCIFTVYLQEYIVDFHLRS